MEASNEGSQFNLFLNICNFCRDADVYLHESTERLTWELNNTGSEGSYRHPFPLFFLEIGGLDTFKRIDFCHRTWQLTSN